VETDLHTIASLLILGVLLPAWLVLGFADRMCHRKSDIAHTSGWRESMWHLLMVAQAGVAVLLAMFFEINALILGIVIVAYIAHELSTSADVGYAAPKRFISVTEQRVHDFLTAIPLAVLLLVIVTHGGQFAALFGMGNEAADFSLRWRENPLPTWYVVTWLLVSPINALIYLEEFWRGVKATRAPRAAIPNSPIIVGSGADKTY